MSQRSYSNDRYRKGATIGSTRKSAAKAKPVRKQGSTSGSSTSKPKPKGSDIEKDWSGLPTSPEIKKWRRIWWALLLGGLAMIGIVYLVPELRVSGPVQSGVSIVVLALSLIAVFIDLRVIRKLRNELIAQTSGKKKAKEQGKAEAKAAAKADATGAKGAGTPGDDAGPRS